MNIRFEEEKRKQRRKEILTEIIKFVIAAILVVVLAWLIMTFAVKKASVIGSGMEKTLYNGEDVLINRAYGVLLGPSRDSVIAFYPEKDEADTTEHDDSSILIRRIVGLPGEKIKIASGKIFIDGEFLEEDYKFKNIQSGGIANVEYTIPEDEYFVLNDNRNDMNDSRSQTFTKVKKDNIIGKVILVLNPFSLLSGPS